MGRIKINSPELDTKKYPCCKTHVGVKRGPWSPDEDHKLVSYIQIHGHKNWRAVPSLAGLNRCGKSCRLRWKNYLRPDIIRQKFTAREEQMILNLHAIWGSKWATIASNLPGRTDNDVKNLWNTKLKKKLIRMGLDPVTRLPCTEAPSNNPMEVLLAEKSDNHNHMQIQHNNNNSNNNNRVVAWLLSELTRLQYLHYQILHPASGNGNTALELAASTPFFQQTPECGNVDYINNSMISSLQGRIRQQLDDDLPASSFPHPLPPDLFHQNPLLPTSSSTSRIPHPAAASSSTASTSGLDNTCNFINSSSFWAGLLG